MKQAILPFATLLVGLVTGYFLYPQLNQNKAADKQAVSSIASSSPEQTPAVIPEVGKNMSLINAEKNEQLSSSPDAQPTGNKPKITPSESSAPATQTSKTQEVTYTPGNEEKKEAEQWLLGHREKIEELINTHVPEEIVDGFKQQIYKDNPFLEEVAILRNAAEDESWAYIKEREIQSYIAKHELASGFLLLNVTCKQKTCDILGTETQAGVWMRIYMSFFSSMSDMDLGNHEVGVRNVQYMSDSGLQVYAQLKFK